MPLPSDLDLGAIKEGVVEINPMSGRMIIRIEGAKGFEFFDLQEALAKYVGQEVRVVIAPFSTINRLAQMVEDGEIPASAVPPAGGIPPRS